MAATAIAAAVGAANGAAISVGTAFAYAAIAAAATYSAQTLAQRQEEAAQRAAGTEGGSTVSFRSSVAPRQIIYGRTRIGGTLGYISTARTGGGILLVDLLVAGHEIDAFEAIWLDETPIPLTTMVTGWGYSTRAVFTTDADGNVFQTDEVVDPGLNVPVYVPASGKYRPNGYIAFACELDRVGSETQPSSDILRSLSPNGEWTTAHQLRGIAHVPMAFSWAPDLFTSGTPNPSVILRGKKVLDTRTSTTAWSDNPALCLRDYLTDSRLGLGAASTEIDTVSFGAAADVCDQIVGRLPAASGGATTEKRFTVGGALSADSTHENNIATLLAAMDGKLVYSGGKFRLYAGAWTNSVRTLTEDDLRGPITIQTQQERAKVFNSARGTGRFPENNYVTTDYPAHSVSAYVTEDQGERLWADIPQPLVPSAAQAQRLARIAIERSRRQQVVQFPATIAALNVLPGETVDITLARFGFVNKTYTVDELKLVIEQDEEGNPRPGVNLVLRALDSNAFTWTTADEQPLEIAAPTNLPNPFTVQPPSDLRVVESLAVVRQLVQAQATLVVTPSPDPFVTGYEFGYRLAGASAWTPISTVPVPYSVVENIAPGDYEFRAAARSTFGVSTYLVLRVAIVGLSAPPAALADVTLQTAGGLAVIQWTRSSDLDVINGGRIEFRHTPATTGATWATATPIGAPADGGASLQVLAFKPGTYLVRPYDSSGTPGPVAVLSADGATALAFTNLSTLTEETLFSGTKVGTVVASGKLKLDASGNIDSASSVDTIPDFDGLGGVLTSGSYTFATTMDLGSIRRTRVVGHIKASIAAVTDLVDSRPGAIDDWPTFDGGDGDEAEAWVEFRDSSDGITYSAWRRCDASETQSRYLQFRAQLVSYDANYNIEVSELRASATGV